MTLRVPDDHRGGAPENSVSDDGPTLRVVVADDQRAVREALATVLDAEAGIEVVGLAADGDEAVALAQRVRHPTWC